MREAAYFVSQQSASAPAGAMQLISGFLRAAYSSWAKRRQIVRLSDADDHILADIGVTREDVRWALDQPFYRDPGAALQRRALRSRQQGWRD